MAGKRKRGYKSKPYKKVRRAYKNFKRRMVAMRPGGWINPSSAIRPEKKYLDICFVDNQIGNDIATGNQIWCINSMAQGSEATQRIGRKICIKSAMLRFNFRANPGDTSAVPANGRGITTTWRVILFLDTQSNNTAPVGTDLITNTDGIGIVNAVNGITNLNNRERFKIITDKVGILNPIGGNTAHEFVKFKRLNFETQFSGPNGGTSITTNALYIMLLCDTASTATAKNFIANGMTRVRFTDC